MQSKSLLALLHLRETQMVLQLQTVRYIIFSGAGKSVVVTASFTELVLSHFQPQSSESDNDGKGRSDKFALKSSLMCS